MYDIDKDLLTLYREIKSENPNIDEELISDFMYRMKDIAYSTLMEKKYGKHLVNREFYDKGVSYLQNNSGKTIGAYWRPEDVMKIAKNYIIIDNEDFYELDLAFQANARYADYSHIISEPSLIIRIAIADLKDADYVYGDASERAYEMCKCLIEEHKEKGG